MTTPDQAPEHEAAKELPPHCREERCAICGEQATEKVKGPSVPNRHPPTWYSCKRHKAAVLNVGSYILAQDTELSEAAEAKRAITEVLGLCDSTAAWEIIIGTARGQIQSARQRAEAAEAERDRLRKAAAEVIALDEEAAVELKKLGIACDLATTNKLRAALAAPQAEKQP